MTESTLRLFDPPITASGDGCRACTKCGELKPTSAFSAKATGRVDGSPGRVYRHSQCKACMAVATRVTSQARTNGTYERIYSDQDGRCECAGCGRWFALNGSGHNRLHIDHNHDTGLVRGLLCANCNTALGKLGDEPSRLRRLADYLEGDQ